MKTMVKLVSVILCVACAALTTTAQVQHDRIQLSQNASVMQNYTSGAAISGGTLVKLNSSNQVISTLTTDLTGYTGIAQTGVSGAGLTVSVALIGQVSWSVDGACTAGNLVINSPTVGGSGHCIASPSSTSQTVGISMTTLGGAGSITVSLTPLSTGGVGGGSSPGGSPIQTQVNFSGSFGGASCHTFTDKDAGPDNFNCDNVIKGLNPYTDVRAYNVRALAASNAIPAVAGITGTINSGSASLAVSTSFCGSQASNVCFVNNDGIVVVGAGPANTMTTPVIGSVVPSTPSGPDGTNTVVNGPTAGTTYNYKLISVDKGRGMTVPSATVSTTVGQASLGKQTVSITSCARSGVIVTCLTAAPHTMAVGTFVGLTLMSDGTFAGGYRIATVPDNTHFTYTSGFDTASGASVSSTGGTAVWKNENFISWIHPPTGAAPQQYIICSDRGGGGFVPIGISKVDNNGSSGTDLSLGFDDLGSPMMDNLVLPYWAGTNPCTAGSPQADELVTTITAGAGTTTLTLAATATTSVVTQAVLFDNTPNFITAATASRTNPLNIPAINIGAGGAFVFNSYMVLPSFTNVCQVGNILLNDTVELPPTGKWSGRCPPQNGTAQSFAWEAHPTISVGPAYPGFYQRSGLMGVDSISFTSVSGNQKILMMEDPGTVPSGYLNDLNFSTSATGDYTGMGLFLRFAGINAPSNIIMGGKFGFIGGAGDGTNWNTTAPLFYCQGGVVLDNISFAKRGIAFKAGSSGQGRELIKNIYMNGGVTPLVMYTSGGTSLGFTFGLVVNDTVPLPFFVNLVSGTSGSLAATDFVTGALSDGVSIPPNVSGYTLPLVNIPIPNGWTNAITGGNFTNNLVSVNGTAGAAGYAMPQNAAPTVAISGGVGPAAATYSYEIFAVDAFGNNSPISNVSAPIVVNGSQGVLVSWTLQPGQIRTTVCRLNACPPSGAGFQVLGTSFLDNGSYFPSVGVNLIATTGLQSGAAAKGFETQSLTLDGTQILAPDSAFDNFNRANGAIGSNWTIQTNGINVASNVIVGTNAGANNAFYNQLPAALGTAQFAEATVGTVGGFIGPTTNAQGLSATYYACLEGSGSLNLQRGPSTNLATASPTTAAGDVLRMENNPNASPNLKCTLTSALGVVTTLTASDNGNTGGAPGVTLNNTTGTLDNWSGGALHPTAQLDVEQSWVPDQHFDNAITVGTPSPIAGALPKGNGYFSGQVAAIGGVSRGSIPPACTVGTAGTWCANEGTAPTGLASADEQWGDSVTHGFNYNANNGGVSSFSGAWNCTNVTPVTVSANVTTDQNLMTCSVPAGVLNRVLRTLKVSLAGVYSTPAASVAVITVKVKVGSLTVATWTSTALGGIQATNDQFNIQDAKFTVQTAGATAAFEAHGSLVIDLGVGNAVADTVFADTNTATVGTVDLTASQTLQVTIAFSTASASNSATQRQLVLETVN